jgi:hypothetical protein
MTRKRPKYRPPPILGFGLSALAHCNAPDLVDVKRSAGDCAGPKYGLTQTKGRLLQRGLQSLGDLRSNGIGKFLRLPDSDVRFTEDWQNRVAHDAHFASASG